MASSDEDGRTAIKPGDGRPWATKGDTVPARGKDWASRRGIGPHEREWNEPWERLRTHIVLHYGLDVDVSRRWERPGADDHRNVALFLRQASAAVDADVARVLSAAAPGLSPTDLDTLVRVAEKPSAGVNLAEYLRVSPVRVCRILDRLVRAGLVVRTETSMDARVRRAEATEAGLALARELGATLDDLSRHWLGGLEDGADEAMLALLATLAEVT